MKAFTSHLKDKDYLLRRSEEILAQHARENGADKTVSCRKTKAHREMKMNQYYRDLQLWVDGPSR